MAATFRAMKDIKADPQVGWDASVATVPELATDPQTPVDLQKAVLAATIVLTVAPCIAIVAVFHRRILRLV